MTNDLTTLYPRQLRENKLYRANILQKAAIDIELQGVLKEKCKRDILYWFNVFAWTYDPRLPGEKHIPFILYDFQKATVQLLADKIRTAKGGQTFGIEKCRDMGVTWMVLGVFFWFWLFERDADFLVGSRKEEFVDKKKHPDTLFGKLNIFLEKTPAWMRPKNFNWLNDFTHMSLQNRETGSLIKGESSNSDFSRAGRYKAVLMDELAFWNNATSAYSAASESCNLIIPVSTPNPEGSGYFKYLVDNKDKYEFMRLEHLMHPNKDEAWLKEQYTKKSPETIAVEILIDYAGAIKGKVYARAMQCRISEEFDYDPKLPLYRGWDFGHGGADDTAIIWFQKDPKTNVVRMIDCYAKNEEDIHYFSSIALGRIVKSEFIYPEDEMDEMKRRELWRAAEDFGDPYSANQRTFIQQTTIAKELEKDGIYIKIKTGTKVQERLEKGRMLMKRLVLHPRALPALEMLAKARFPSKPEKSQSTTAPSLPVHDETSHYRTAYEYFADNEPDLSEKIISSPIRSKYNQRKTESRLGAAFKVRSKYN